MPGHKENASQAENIGFAAQEPVKAVAAPKAARARPSATGTRQTRTEQLKKEDIGTVTLRRSPRFLVAEDASTFTLVETREPLAPLSRTNTRVTRSATPKQQLFNLPADLPKLPELPLTKSDLAPFLKTHDTWKSIRKGPFLASGGYGTVYAAVKRGGRAVAVKQISVAVDQKLDTFDHLLLPEFDLLSQMQEHPNIAGAIQMFIPRNTLDSTDREDQQIFNRLLDSKSKRVVPMEAGPDAFLVMDRARGDLFTLIPKLKDIQDPKSRENILKIIGFQILVGLQFLHKQRIIHRDLKLENILVFGEGPGYGIKISDFNLSAVVKPGGGRPSLVGTSGYMAPEVVLESVYSFNADSFSFGCMLWEMLTCGEEPFFPDLHNFGASNDDDYTNGTCKSYWAALGNKDLSTSELGTVGLALIKAAKRASVDGRLPPTMASIRERLATHGVSESAVDLQEKLLRLEPSQRPSAAEARRHPFFSSVDPALIYSPKDLKLFGA